MADLLPPVPPRRRGALRPFLAGLAVGVAVTLVAVLLPGDGGPAGALNALRRSGPAQLVRDGGAPRANPRAQVKRARPVTLDRSALFDADGRPRGPEQLARVGLRLFDDATFTGAVERMSEDPGGATWSGPLEGVPGSFQITAVDDAVLVHVGTTRGVFEIASTAQGSEAVEVDQSTMADGPVLATFTMPSAPVAVLLAPVQVDVLALYTKAAREAEGSTSALRARIRLATEQANASYANSGVNLVLRLVHAEEVTYTETGKIETDLAALRTASDGKLDVAQTLRDTYGADVVGLIVEAKDWCGMAAAIGSTAATAFQVTSRTCASGYYSWAHEFGHLFGARHDTHVDGGTTPYAHGHGHVNKGTTAETRWRTIMAYNDACSADGFDCTRINLWSNPTVEVGGVATGVAGTSENARVLNAAAGTVAGYRAPVVSGDMTSPFTNAWTGWQAVTGSWGLDGLGSFVSNGVVGGWASTAHTTQTWGDLVYEVRMRRTGTCLSCANRVVIRGTGAATGSYYAFAYSNDGKFLVSRVTNGAFWAYLGWTPSAAIVRGGWNTLRVTAAGSLLRFSINGTEVWWGTDATHRLGGVGVGFARDANAGRLEIDYAKVTTGFQAGG